MIRYLRLICFMLVMIASYSYAEMKLSITGLSGELSDNVYARVELIDPTSINNTSYFKRYLESEIKKALKALGYYAPKFSYQLTNNNKTLLVTVFPGAPVLLEELNINIYGDGAKNGDFNDFIKNNAAKKGAVLNHGVYETFKKELQNLALRKGYFNAKLTKHQLAVADKNNQAYWNIDFDTGKRYKFGDIIFSPSQINSDYLINLVPFQEGDEYNADLITRLNRRMSATNWFNSVIISPDFTKVTKDNAVPINILTTERKKNNIDLGFGFSSDNGFSTKIGWNKPWINSFGHSFQSSLYFSSPEQNASISYKIPIEQSPLNNYYSVQSGFKKVNDNDTKSDIYTFGILRNWDNYHEWKAALGLNLMHDNFVQADLGYTTMLYYPSLNLYKTTSDRKLLPMKGFSQSYSFETASQYLASDIDFIRLQIQYSWIQSIGNSHRFIARSNISVIRSSDFSRVPPTFRFFAGGDRSIRGFNYQSISPKDENGKLVGASKLITESFEYQYNISDVWWGALYIDTGEAVQKWTKTDFQTGVGFGIRWVSPIGSVKVDLAAPIDELNFHSSHLYIGLGTEL